MSLLKIKINKIISKSNNFTKFEGSYCGGCETFSPRGFVAVVEGDQNRYNVGTIFNYNPNKFMILEFGEGHKEIMDDFAQSLKNL